MARRGKLTDEHRAFIVREIAAFETPSAVAAAVKEEFGIEITRQNVEHYDPSKNLKLSKKWREYHAVMRKAWREKTEDLIPLANKFVRLRELSRLATGALAKNPLGKAQILEQIAKEVGNVHSNRREVSGPGGKPLQFEDVSTMTPDQISAELAEHLKDPAMRAFVAGIMSTEAGAISPPQAQEQKDDGRERQG